jgi:hypothetical protein
MKLGVPIVSRALVPVSVPTIGPLANMAEALAEYLRCAEFVVWGADAANTTFKLVRVTPEWPDAGTEMVYPSASLVESTDTFQEASNFTPRPMEETLGVFDGLCGNGPNDPTTVLWKLGEASVEFQLDFWTTSIPDREAIEALLPTLFNVSQERAGLLLGGHPRYFGRSVRATLESVRRMDEENSVYPNERRLMCAVRAETDTVRLCRAALMAPTVRVEAIDPNDPPQEQTPS